MASHTTPLLGAPLAQPRGACRPSADDASGLDASLLRGLIGRRPLRLAQTGQFVERLVKPLSMQRPPLIVVKSLQVPKRRLTAGLDTRQTKHNAPAKLNRRKDVTRLSGRRRRPLLLRRHNLSF